MPDQISNEYCPTKRDFTKDEIDKLVWRFGDPHESAHSMSERFAIADALVFLQKRIKDLKNNDYRELSIRLSARIAKLEAALIENGRVFASYGDHVRQAGCYAIAGLDDLEQNDA